MALYFNGFYSAALFILLLLIAIYKCGYLRHLSASTHALNDALPAAVMLPFPQHIVGVEVAMIFFFAIVEYVRLTLGEQEALRLSEMAA